MSGIIQGATGVWEMVIGLEVHAQVTSNSKLFSGAATAFGAEPNSQVSLVDAAMPGMLPVINKVCVEQAVRTGLGLKAQINLHSVFDRKNYFYPDLPQGYQISQFLQPVVGAGTLVLDMEDGTSREIGITRLHLEQDAGKSVHDMHPDRTYVDLNRSGIALMEIVSDPDLRTPSEAGAYLRKMRSILRYLGTCDGNMEEGSMRADVNVSIRRPGDDYGTRCEIKNVNSVRFVEQAIQIEAQRQVDILEDGGTILQETRLFDPRKMETRSMRSKEEAHDYRYFPDPDLLPLEFEQAWVDAIAASLPELPDDRKVRFVEALGLSSYDAGVLVAEKEVANYFEAVATGRDAKVAANWITGDLFGALNKAGCDVADSPIAVADLGALIDLIADDTISGRIAKDVFDEMFKTGRAPGKIVEEKGLRQVTDSGAIEAIVDAVMESNQGKVAEYRGGKDKLLGFFVGQVMKQSQGKANPKI
ncbi:MAG: Asp-tRNA(Asn)/Glu-tRNA(Gln) amidotransferase subunit GatB, partial [Alphaproteobacteria bacterium]|nr:Asp-tRNA(Asn)/Glu-tRNA(Gln) amidotransferase subunit GatB [Alphaproteobacteria bacterium]